MEETKEEMGEQALIAKMEAEKQDKIRHEELKARV
jgi:hypothetical protein